MHSSLRVPWVLLFLFVALISPVLNAPRATAADENAELDRRTNYWRTQLPFCNWPGFAPYPSKFDDVLPDPADPLKGQCNDGDSVIFNGVLCASGDDRGCDAVRRSQAPDGEFWRSPRKVGVFSKDETPFSDDHFLGVWAYIAHKKDIVSFRKWIDWIDGQPRPRVCQDDKCTFGVSDCPMLDILALLLLESNKVCDPQHKLFDAATKAVGDAEKRFSDATAQLYEIPGSEILRPTVELLKTSFVDSLEILRKTTAKAEEIRIQAATYARVLAGPASLIVAINTAVNEEGPGQWDAAVEVLLLKKYVRINMPGFVEATGILALKQPENPFFEYVTHGPTERMLSQILAKCPAPENDPPHARFQWTWERADNEQPPPWKKTMYWDCLTVANLYKDGPPYARAELPSPDLSRTLDQANAAAANASLEVNSIIASIESLIEDCKKLDAKCVGSLLTAPLERAKQEANHALDQISKGEIPTPLGTPPIPEPPIPGLPAPPAERRAGPVPEPPGDPGPPIINRVIRQVLPHFHF